MGYLAPVYLSSSRVSPFNGGRGPCFCASGVLLPPDCRWKCHGRPGCRRPRVIIVRYSVRTIAVRTLEYMLASSYLFWSKQMRVVLVCKGHDATRSRVCLSKIPAGGAPTGERTELKTDKLNRVDSANLWVMCRLIRAYRPKFIRHPTSTPFFGDKMLKFSTRVL